MPVASTTTGEAVNWRDALIAEWQAREQQSRADLPLFPLIAQGFDAREIVAAVETLMTGRITMGDSVRAFEDALARHLGVPYAVMVNSGSSANLLAVAVMGNPARQRHLKPGDEVLVPAVCWPTSVWPIVQLGYRPVFVDVDPATLNISIEDLRRRITPLSRAIVAVHILGNSVNTEALQAVAQEHDLFLLEDTCESLGSESYGRPLGTLGDLGTFSFYYSHHITTGEGGAVVCHTQEDADLLRCLRAHGWSRDLSNRRQVEAEHADIDSRFLFVNTGFNVRPLEIQAAFGLQQLERLPSMNATRNRNLARLHAALQAHQRWTGQFSFPAASPGTIPAWFGSPFLLNASLASQKRDYLGYLGANGVETRPIVSGNFIRQPALALLGFDLDPAAYPGAEEIDRRGFFIGVHTEPLADAKIERLADIIQGYDAGA